MLYNFDMRHCASNSLGPRGAYEVFISRIQMLQKIYAQAGYFIRALSPNLDAKKAFLSLPLAKQDQINAKLGDELEFYQDCLEKKLNLASTREIVEAFAGWRKMRLPASALEKIRPESLVEIFDMRLNRLYRSTNFFSYTSHSLEDLESRPHRELFKESQRIERAISRSVARLRDGQEENLGHQGVHRAWEINSRKKIVTQKRTESLTPVFCEEDSSPAGFMYVYTVLNQTELSLIGVDHLAPGTPPAPENKDLWGHD